MRAGGFGRPACAVPVVDHRRQPGYRCDVGRGAGRWGCDLVVAPAHTGCDRGGASLSGVQDAQLRAAHDQAPAARTIGPPGRICPGCWLLCIFLGVHGSAVLGTVCGAGRRSMALAAGRGRWLRPCLHGRHALRACARRSRRAGGSVDLRPRRTPSSTARPSTRPAYWPWCSCPGCCCSSLTSRWQVSQSWWIGSRDGPSRLRMADPSRRSTRVPESRAGISGNLACRGRATSH